MKTKKEIKAKLKEFRTSPNFINKTPEELGILAAVQFGYLYGEGANHQAIKQFWSSKLRNLGEKYSEPGNHLQDFINDIQKLKEDMNTKFPGSFSNSKSDYDDEFRLAHAQKSLSIYLKHLWARNLLNGNEPPFCPIDKVILKQLGIQDPWTRINSFDDRVQDGKVIRGYKYYMEMIQDTAEAVKESAAVWELFKWQPNNTSKKTKKGKKAIDNVSDNNDVKVTLLKEGEKVLDRTGRALYGYKISTRNRDLYVYTAKDSQKCFCNIISSDGKYTDKEINTIQTHNCFIFHTPQKSRSYYIRKFKNEEIAAAKELTKRMKEELEIE